MEYRGVLLAEGEVVEVVSFPTKAELLAYSRGVGDTAARYDAGSCCVYDKGDVELLDCGDRDDQAMAKIIRKALRREDG